MNTISQATINTVIAITATLILSACSSVTTPSVGKGQQINQFTEPSTIKDTKISLDFTDEGIKIFYSSFGNLERIEVYGQAPAWKGNHTVLAEADAMDKLVKFVHGQSVSSNKKVEIISKAIDMARDENLNASQSADGSVALTEKQVQFTSLPAAPSSSKDAKNKRIAETVDQTMLNTVNTMSSQGRLTAVRKVRDELSGDGKIYVAVYQWSKQDQASASYVRSLMK
jgi:F0F1-type ATP synthase delta subunit